MNLVFFTCLYDKMLNCNCELRELCVLHYWFIQAIYARDLCCTILCSIWFLFVLGFSWK